MAFQKTAQEMAEMYETAIINLVEGELQSYTIPNRGTFTKHDLPKLERSFQYWSSRASALTGGAVKLIDVNTGSSQS